MRVLSEERTRILFEKLTKYIGVNVKLLIDRPDGTYCFREKKDRVYYVSERLLQLAQTVKPDHLICAGTCFGKFTKTNKFRLHITALTYIAPYAQYKIWVKPSSEQQFLYGHHVIKSGLGRITENTPKHQGVVIQTMSDIPIGFGVTARTTTECRNADPLATIAFHQADIGEYIRSEDTLHVLSSHRYAYVTTLVQLYQMETRWPLRQLLLQAFGVMCGLERTALATLALSHFIQINLQGLPFTSARYCEYISIHHLVASIGIALAAASVALFLV